MSEAMSESRLSAIDAMVTMMADEPERELCQELLREINRLKIENTRGVPMLAIRDWQDMNHAAHVDGAKTIHCKQVVDVRVIFPDGMNPPVKHDKSADSRFGYCAFGDWTLIPKQEGESSK